MQQLRQHYERQDTEELLEIAKKELRDEARVVLEQVLEARGISEPQAEAARAQGIADREKFIAIDSRLASRWKRLAAFLIDSWGVFIVLLLLSYPLALISTELQGNLIGIVWFSYFLLRDSIPGQSIGKRLLNLRVIKIESNKSCTWLQSIGRNLPHIFFLIDAVFILGDRHMRIGDMLANTIVVRTNDEAPHDIVAG
jgi:uncharacterized RDD family membrane protein YckC